MKKNKVLSPISFADAEYKSFQMSEDDTLTIFMNTWQEDCFKIIFRKVIQFTYKLGDVPQGLYEIESGTPLLNETLTRKYVKIPLNHPYKLFHLEDIDDFPFIQVVAKSVEVIKN